MAEEHVMAPTFVGPLGLFLCGSVVAIVVLIMIVVWYFVAQSNTASQREVDALREENKRLREENERLKKTLTPSSTDIQAH